MTMFRWYTRNDDGFWCDFCGDLIKPMFHFECDEDADTYEPAECRNCGAPDDFDPDAL